MSKTVSPFFENQITPLKEVTWVALNDEIPNEPYIFVNLINYVLPMLLDEPDYYRNDTRLLSEVYYHTIDSIPVIVESFLIDVSVRFGTSKEPIIDLTLNKSDHSLVSGSGYDEKSMIAFEFLQNHPEFLSKLIFENSTVFSFAVPDKFKDDFAKILNGDFGNISGYYQQLLIKAAERQNFDVFSKL